MRFHVMAGSHRVERECRLRSGEFIRRTRASPRYGGYEYFRSSWSTCQARPRRPAVLHLI